MKGTRTELSSSDLRFELFRADKLLSSTANFVAFEPELAGSAMRGIALHDHIDVGPVECARDAVEVQVVGALRVQLTEWQTRAPRQVAFADVRLHAAVRVVKLAAQLTNQYQP